MADDPNRDILPVREGSCPDTCRSTLIDPRERHVVYKLDRDELEDKYLRLLEEASNLKKLSHCQEDKIKRLATKLMRLTSRPRACTAALDIYENKNKMVALELENTKLKDKVSVMRNQLLSHTISSRSSSRSRNPQTRPSSGRVTCRSESSRTQVPSYHCIIQTRSDDHAMQSNRCKIEELEAEKQEMSNRITQLEKELSTCMASSQREKAAENVEYIRVWRQMKLLNEKLIVSQATNQSLNDEVSDLKIRLDDTSKNNQEVTAALLEEKKRIHEIDEQLMKTKDSQLSLREKDEQIKGLLGEMKILQQHNHELISLSTKAGEVELENIELKRKVNEQFRDQQTLKSAYHVDQDNIVALQASNEQLLGKLKELQKNIDTLTVQLMSFQTQTERPDTSAGTQISCRPPDRRTPSPNTQKTRSEKSTQIEKCRKCTDAYEKFMQLEEAAGRELFEARDRFVQTEIVQHSVTVAKKDQATSVMTPEKERINAEPKEEVGEQCAALDDPLTPERMLKLLEQAQINVPVEAASGTETITQADQENQTSTCVCERSDKIVSTLPSVEEPSNDPSRVLSMLFNILQEWSGTTGPTLLAINKDQPAKDINNNDETVRADRPRKCRPQSFVDHTTGTDDLNKTATKRTGCTARKNCSNAHTKLRQDRLKKRNAPSAKKRVDPVKSAELSDCTCTEKSSCNPKTGGCGPCCNDSPKLNTVDRANNADVEVEVRSATTQNSVKNVGPPKTHVFSNPVSSYSQTGIGSTQMSCKLQKESNAGPYRPRRCGKRSNHANDDQSLTEYMKQLDKCRDILNNTQLLNDVTTPVKKTMENVDIKDSIQYTNKCPEQCTDMQRIQSSCSVNCPNECINVTSNIPEAFPLVISEGEGLMELHIVSLQLSTSAKQILFQDDISNVSLFVGWDLWNQDTAYTPPMKCPRLNFNSSFVYRIPDLFSFFSYVLLEFVIFQVNVFHGASDGYMVARGKLCVKDILDYPQNKLHYIAPVNSVLPCTVGINFGQLSLWVRLSCDLEKVEAFKNKHGLHAQSDYSHSPQRKTGREVTEADRQQHNGLVVLKSTDSKEGIVHNHSKEGIVHNHSKEGIVHNHSKEGIVHNHSKEQLLQDTLISTHQIGEGIRDSPSIPSQYSQHTDPEETKERHRPKASVSSGEIPAIYLSSSTETTAEENEGKKKSIQDSPREDTMTDRNGRGMDIPIDSSSILEFNDLISNSKNKELEPQLSKHSIDEVTDVFNEKKWEEYRRRSLASVFRSLSGDTLKSRTTETPSEGPHEKDTIVIEIVNTVLFPKSSVMLNDDIKLIYVEYSFLGYCGEELETVSVEKPKTPNQKLTYNFRKKFYVDEYKHKLQDNILRSMLVDSSNPNIKFIVVSEPLPDETDSKECVEIGASTFNIREYALGDSEKIVSLPIFNPDETEQIGLLKIFVLGLDTIRQRLGRRESNM